MSDNKSNVNLRSIKRYLKKVRWRLERREDMHNGAGAPLLCTTLPDAIPEPWPHVLRHHDVANRDGGGTPNTLCHVMPGQLSAQNPVSLAPLNSHGDGGEAPKGGGGGSGGPAFGGYCGARKRQARTRFWPVAALPSSAPCGPGPLRLASLHAQHAGAQCMSGHPLLPPTPTLPHDGGGGNSQQP